MPRHSETVGADCGGMRLADYLQRRWPRADRVVLRRMVLNGDITVNRFNAKLQQRLKPGDHLDLAWPEGGVPERRCGEAAQSASLRVLCDRPFGVVVDKPSGVYTVPDRQGRDQGVHGMLTELGPGRDLRIAHRLDRDTSGCLALAAGLDAARFFDQVFRDGLVHKEYVALVHGRVSRDQFEITRHLGPDPRRQGYVVPVAAGTKKSRSAHTEVVVEERFRAHTLVRMVPKTGRGHQLRVHMQSCGHPIVGDGPYGGRPLRLSEIKPGYKLRKGVEERPLVSRLFLHAERLRVPSPASVDVAIDGDAMDVTAPLPRELDVALAKLRRFSGAQRASGHGPDEWPQGEES